MTGGGDDACREGQSATLQSQGLRLFMESTVYLGLSMPVSELRSGINLTNEITAVRPHTAPDALESGRSRTCPPGHPPSKSGYVLAHVSLAPEQPRCPKQHGRREAPLVGEAPRAGESARAADAEAICPPCSQPVPIPSAHAAARAEKARSLLLTSNG